MKSIQEKIKELKNVTCTGIKEKKVNFCTKFYEFELDNGEFILINDFCYNGTKFNQAGAIDAWCAYKESVIDRIDDDEFWDRCEEYFSDDFKLYIYDGIDKDYVDDEIYDQYVDVINDCFKIEAATSDFQD